VSARVGRFALGAFALSTFALVPCSCAAALGLEDPGSSISELCRCDALTSDALISRCEALAAAKEDDVEFVRTYVAAGCPSCKTLPACLALLGATKNGDACTEASDCASLHCCPDQTCCTCSECSGPAPHCTTLFDGAAGCLYQNHGALCGGACNGEPPGQVGDGCWTCLEGQESVQQKCQQQIEACLAEPPQ
jgi:hypothetical protein